MCPIKIKLYSSSLLICAACLAASSIPRSKRSNSNFFNVPVQYDLRSNSLRDVPVQPDFDDYGANSATDPKNPGAEANLAENPAADTETEEVSPFDHLKSGFVASFLMILASEIADKTFFIAAILSGQYPKGIIFTGAFSSLILMTVLSVAVGQVFLKFMPLELAEFLSNCLFLIFGLNSLREGIKMKNKDDSEFRETAKELKEKGLNRREPEIEMSVAVDESQRLQVTSNSSDNENNAMQSNAISKSKRSKSTATLASIQGKDFKPLLTSFSMTFLAEWGDRSQIATINLGATHGALGVCLGGILGHMICTGIACVGGSLFAEKLNAKTITLVGAVFFLAFGLYGLVKMHFDGDYTVLLKLVGL